MATIAVATIAVATKLPWQPLLYCDGRDVLTRVDI